MSMITIAKGDYVVVVEDGRALIKLPPWDLGPLASVIETYAYLKGDDQGRRLMALADALRSTQLTHLGRYPRSAEGEPPPAQ